MARKESARPKPAWAVRWYVHFSPRVNRASIKANGLWPHYDRRGKGRVWVATNLTASWALSHVSETHVRDATDFDAWLINPRVKHLVKHRQGVYYTLFPIPPEQLKLVSGESLFIACQYRNKSPRHGRKGV